LLLLAAAGKERERVFEERECLKRERVLIKSVEFSSSSSIYSFKPSIGLCHVSLHRIMPCVLP